MRVYDNPPAEFSAKTYGVETKITLPSSDMDIHELLDVFRRLTIACQFSEEIWRYGVMTLADQYETDMKEEEGYDGDKP